MEPDAREANRMNGRDTLDQVVLLRAIVELLQRHLQELSQAARHLSEAESGSVRAFHVTLEQFGRELAQIECRLIEQQG